MEDHVTTRYLSPKEAASYLSLSVWSLYRLVSRRSIPFIALRPGRAESGHGRATLRFDAVELDRWMHKQAIRAVTRDVVEADI